MLKRRWRLVFGIFLFTTLGGSALLGLAWWRVSLCRPLAHGDPEAVPHRKVGLVLGCSPRLTNGQENWFFLNRMAAAAKLFKSGKVDYLLVSGDNQRRTYDEPTEMKNALIERGVPADRIVCDFAGITTLDSVVRARKVFGQDAVTIISQRFHNERAIYLARAYGVDAIGFNADDVPLAAAPRTYLRETLSRMRACLDANIFRRKPRHLGPPVVIGSL